MSGLPECSGRSKCASQSSVSSAGGIGIANVRRRLETLFGRQAELRLRPDGDVFRVELELPAQPREATA